MNEFNKWMNGFNKTSVNHNKAGLFESSFFWGSHFDATAYLEYVEIKKRYWYHLLNADIVSFFVTRKCEKSEKSMKIVNIDGEYLHIFWTTWGISM